MPKGPWESRVQPKGECAPGPTRWERCVWPGVSDLLRNWQGIRNQDTVSPLPHALDMLLKHRASHWVIRPVLALLGLSIPLDATRMWARACHSGDPCPPDRHGQL